MALLVQVPLIIIVGSLHSMKAPTCTVCALIVKMASVRDHRIEARLAGEKVLRELNQPIHTEYNKRKPQQPKRHANLRGFANRVYPGQSACAFESAECNRKALHDHQSP